VSSALTNTHSQFELTEYMTYVLYEEEPCILFVSPLGDIEPGEGLRAQVRVQQLHQPSNVFKRLQVLVPETDLLDHIASRNYQKTQRSIERAVARAVQLGQTTCSLFEYETSKTIKNAAIEDIILNFMLAWYEATAGILLKVWDVQTNTGISERRLGIVLQILLEQTLLIDSKGSIWDLKLNPDKLTLIRTRLSQNNQSSPATAQDNASITVQSKEMVMTPQKNTVFLIHGRNAKAKSAMVAFLRALALRPIDWEEAVRATGSGSPTTLEIVRKGLEIAHAAIVLMSPDEIVSLHPDLAEPHELEPTMQVRPNVILEAGIALSMKPQHTVFVRTDGQREISDISGVNYIFISDNGPHRKNLLDRLNTIGLECVDTGSDWLHAGNFKEAILKPIDQKDKKQDNGVPEGIKTLKKTIAQLKLDLNSLIQVYTEHDRGHDKGQFLIGKLKVVLVGHASDLDGYLSANGKKELGQILADCETLSHGDWNRRTFNSEPVFWPNCSGRFEALEKMFANPEMING
jgi:predicted nucleotide-binding protein